MKLSEKLAAMKAAAAMQPIDNKDTSNAQVPTVSSMDSKEEAIPQTEKAASSQSVQQEAASNEAKDARKVEDHDTNRVSDNATDANHGVQSEDLRTQQGLSGESRSPEHPAQAEAKEIIHAAVDEAKKKESLSERLARLKAEKEALALVMEPPAVLPSDYTASVEEEIIVPADTNETFSLNISLNAKQLAAKEMALAGKSFCLIGAAGTGKTTTQREVASSLLKDNRLRTTSFKLQGGGGTRVDAPSIAFCAYTRRASANLARAVHKDPVLKETLQYNIMTIHALLEYEPETFWDAEKEKESMRFLPRKTRHNPLSITHLVIEEASMVGLDLWEALYDALLPGVQIIFIGDINQLPPVFGASILNYALVQLPIVELTEVYRQAGDSLVLANAHHILKGESLEEGNGFNIIRGKNNVQVGQEKMSQTLGKMFEVLHERGDYDPEQDIILSPFNKQALGTDNMNKWIAEFLGKKNDAIIYEIIAGFNKHYLAVGDKVMYNKQDSTIVEIKANMSYHGKTPQIPGKDLTRFGHRILGHGADADVDLDELVLNYSEFSVEELAEETGERKQQASHTVTIKTENGGTEILSAAGDFSPQVFSLGYVLTVHKAQGCEWRKVFFILHKDHAVMLNRELFYTGVTRAREEVNLIAKDYVIEKAIRNQKIKGNSLEDKIEYFNSGAVDASQVQCTK